MKSFSLVKLTMTLIFVTLFFSCAPRKEVIYYQNIDQIKFKKDDSSYEVKIHPDDLLMIIVGAFDSETAAPFNLNTFMSNTTSIGMPQVTSAHEPSQNYLVDSKGFINFPNIGEVQIGGLTRTEAIKMIENKLSKFIKNPFVNLKILNFKFSVQGEVVRPGTFDVRSERITLIEALSMANDLTIYGRRDNILLIREENGVKTFNRIDITKADFINSPYYYLVQNDVIYVEPNKTKIRDRAVGANTGVILTAVSIIVSLATTLIVILR